MIAAAKQAVAHSTPCMTLYLVRHAESLNNKVVYDHRETGWGKYLRYPDPDLSPLGNVQAIRLGEHLAQSPDPISEHIRSWKDLGDRFALYSSPMRRALKTTWGISKGLEWPTASVISTAFEHGGCFHGWPTLAEERGISALAAADDAKKYAASVAKIEHYPGLTAAEVTDPTFVCRYLNVPEQETRQVFTEAELSMEQGWWAPYAANGVETRRQCFLRGAGLAKRFVALAGTGEIDIAVLVSHGDLMDCILKELLMPGMKPEVQDAACRFVHTNTGITRVEIARDGTAYLLKYNATPHLDNCSEQLTGGELVHDWDCWDRYHKGEHHGEHEV